jgi:UDP-galactose transporter B1
MVSSAVPVELRLLLYTVSLYVIFIYWGYLQEKLTSRTYNVSGSEDTRTWQFAFALNFSMAAICSTVAAVVEKVMGPQEILAKGKKKTVKGISAHIFWKAAACSALASPIGYTSLRYLSYPMMILTKAAKPVPVIIVGVVSYNRKYPWYKYTSILLLVIGISLFTAYKGSSSGKVVEDKGMMTLLFGMFLVLVNLGLDGFTNNEQDHIFNHHKLI